MPSPEGLTHVRGRSLPVPADQISKDLSTLDPAARPPPQGEFVPNPLGMSAIESMAGCRFFEARPIGQRNDEAAQSCANACTTRGR